jgi:hypothetical protein
MVVARPNPKSHNHCAAVLVAAKADEVVDDRVDIFGIKMGRAYPDLNGGREAQPKES